MDSYKSFSFADNRFFGTLQLDWKDPDEEGLIKFLVEQKGFNLERVQSGIKKLKDAKGKSSQTRLESFFGAATHIKRKSTEPENKNSKKGKTAALLKGKK
jgi:flap endonuclease-1